jgi:hypothetical protein
MFLSAQFGAWLFYASLFILFTPTLCGRNDEQNALLVKRIINSTQLVEPLYVKMYSEMQKKLKHFQQLAADIVVGKHKVISDEFAKRKENFSKIMEVITAVEKNDLVQRSKEMDHIHDYLTLKENISPSLIAKISKELEKIKADGKDTEVQKNKLTLYEAFLEYLEKTLKETNQLIEDVVSSAQFLQDHEEVIYTDLMTIRTNIQQNTYHKIEH